MRRFFSAAGYIFAHVLFYTALFLPPVFIPDHSMKGGGEYDLWLILTLWPICSLAAGMVFGLIPGFSGKFRLLAEMAGLSVAFVCLCLDGSEALETVLVFGLMYAAGFGVMHLIRSFFRGYREFREKGERK